MRVLMLVLIAGLAFTCGCQESNSPVGEASIPATKQFVVYDFWAPWCGPCKAFAPTFEKLKEKYSRPNVVFKRVNVDEEQELAQKFAIGGIPTILVTADGKEVARHEGAASENASEKWLVKALR